MTGNDVWKGYGDGVSGQTRIAATGPADLLTTEQPIIPTQPSLQISRTPGRITFRTKHVCAFLLLITAIAFVLMYYDYNLAQHTTTQRIFVIFWVSLTLGLGSMLGLGLALNSRAGRASMLALIGIFTYEPKYLLSPYGPRYFDEYGQFRHINDVLHSGNLFSSNSYQPILRDYPGLTLATAPIHLVTGLSVWHSGQLVILLAHCSALLTIAAIARTVGVSERSAFLAAVIYALNPSYMYFDTQFSYESLALPVGFIAILGCIKCFASPAQVRTSQQNRRRLAWNPWIISGVIAMLACALTHHISSLFVVGMCFVISLSFTIRHVRGDVKQRLLAGWIVTAAGAIATSLWLSLVATSIGSYLGPHFQGAFDELLQVTGLQSKPAVTGAIPSKHTLFAGSQLPSYEELAAVATPFIALLIVGTCFQILWRKRHQYPLDVAKFGPFAILATAYFVSLPFSLTTVGSEISHRSWGYSYLGIAIVVGLTIDRFPAFSQRVSQRLAVALLVSILPLTVGNIALGVDVSYRFPGPYEFGTDTRSGSPELTSIISWLNGHAAPNSGVITDRFTSEYVTAYTRLRVPTPTQTLPMELFAAPTSPPQTVKSAIRQEGFEYFIVDQHIFSEQPRIEFYPGASSYSPVDIQGLKNLSGGNNYLQAVVRTAHYVVYQIHS